MSRNDEYETSQDASFRQLCVLILGCAAITFAAVAVMYIADTVRTPESLCAEQDKLTPYCAELMKHIGKAIKP